MYDIIIIGCGCAGMTAAIYSLRAGKSVLVFESENVGGQITYSPRVENYPGIKRISGSEFADGLFEQVTDLGAEVSLEKVTSLEKRDELWHVITEDGEYDCRSVIIASGAKHRHLGLEREEELSGISYCAVCDGAFYKGKRVAVAGGGNTALQAALFLSEGCSKVTLIHRRNTFRGESELLARAEAKENITILRETKIVSLEGKNDLEALIIDTEGAPQCSALAVDGLFVSVGQEPCNGAFANVVELDEAGYVIAGEDCRTSAEGIFVAGDCRTKTVRQLTTAAADGAVAALAACTYADRVTAE